MCKKCDALKARRKVYAVAIGMAECPQCAGYHGKEPNEVGVRQVGLASAVALNRRQNQAKKLAAQLIRSIQHKVS